MQRTPLDIYDDMPDAMKKYIKANGWHFTQKACEYAVKHMRRRDSAGKAVPIERNTRDQLIETLAKFSINVENDIMADALFVWHMAKADYYRSSVPDEQHLAMFVKDYLDDPDAPDGVAMRRWVATMDGLGVPIDWEDMQ